MLEPDIVRDVIGEGAYGCVHKPSIHCKTGVDQDFNYDDYVSKIMKTRHAEAELKEFLVIGSYDKTNEYHLGAPILCNPKLNNQVTSDISKCDNIFGEDVKSHPDKYKILLLKFGGPDLKYFCNEKIKDYLKTKKREKTDLFWLEVHHLLKGLKFFHDNQIVHNDIKPHNILFDTKTGKLKYIDFGLMRKKSTIINSSKDNSNFLGIFHWSYPFDCGFMTKAIYNNYSAASREKRNKYKTELSEMIISKSKINTVNLPINSPDAFNILFKYINPDIKPPAKYAFIEQFFDGLNTLVDSKSYDQVLNHFIDSIDIFGLGFTLQFMLNCFKTQKAINIESFTRLSSFFHKMYDFNPSTREINIDALIDEYENILLEIGILTRLKKTFENHIAVKTKPMVIKKEKKNNLIEETPLKDLEKIAMLDPVHISQTKKQRPKPKQKQKQNISLMSQNCPPNKMRNPITRRCVKKCNQGFVRQVRNNKFKCVVDNSPAFCKQNKTRNPITRRCVKKCNWGYFRKIRNNKFKCLVNPQINICDLNKTRNPITSRCVKNCKPGHIRNDKFKCISSKTRKNKK